MKKPVIGERWTDHPNLPHGTQRQIAAWLLETWNPRLVVITATDAGRHGGIEPGQVGYARAQGPQGRLGRQQVMDVKEFMGSFQSIPDGAPDPWDIPPERPR